MVGYSNIKVTKEASKNVNEAIFLVKTKTKGPRSYFESEGGGGLNSDSKWGG